MCVCLNKMRCQFFIGGKKVDLFAMTEQQHLSYRLAVFPLRFIKHGGCGGSLLGQKQNTTFCFKSTGYRRKNEDKIIL